LYELSNVRFLDIKELLEEGKVEKKIEQNTAVPYFLIIDEINRGNISKIFGELITLIEKDKRDKIKVRLPYSQKEFSLPSNLYIVGTMNTADRSIAVLDTALRRRFYFKEVEPSVEVIKSEYSQIEDLDLAILFETLNSKITNKLDRDHRLGHSYFLEVFSMAEFRIKWYYQIIPLLMEYFYNDPESIAAIITDAFIDKKTGQVKWISSDIEFKDALLNIK
jgi:5-methylcytosine-specific restriction enzyme B